MTGEFTEQAIRYFLSELSEVEQSAVEERFFADENYSRFLDSAEDDLIDDYVCGRLDFKQTRDFEIRYLISERRRGKVRAAKNLQTANFAEKEKSGFALVPNFSVWRRLENLFRVPRSVFAFGFAAVALLISLGGLWLADSPENNQTAKIENESQTPIVEASNRFLSSTVSPDKILQNSQTSQKRTVKSERLKFAAKPNLETRQIASLVKPKSNLLPAFSLPVRNGEKSLIVETSNTKNIRLIAAARDSREFVSYRVEIHAADGDLLWSREFAANQKTPRQPIALNVRSGALATGSYELTLNGITADNKLEEINFYNFMVE